MRNKIKHDPFSKIKNLMHPERKDGGLNIILDDKNTTEIKNKLPPCEETGYFVHEHGEASEKNLRIYVSIETITRIKKHALEDTNKELAGLLAGEVNRHNDKNYINITASIPAQHTYHSGSSVTFTHKTWEQIYRTMDRDYPDKIILGWYHTHPNFGIFLSGDDIFIHKNFFNNEWLVAFVIDPVRNNSGFFNWENGEIVKSGGYYIYKRTG